MVSLSLSQSVSFLYITWFFLIRMNLHVLWPPRFLSLYVTSPCRVWHWWGIPSLKVTGYEETCLEFVLHGFYSKTYLFKSLRILVRRKFAFWFFQTTFCCYLAIFYADWYYTATIFPILPNCFLICILLINRKKFIIWIWKIYLDYIFEQIYYIFMRFYRFGSFGQRDSGKLYFLLIVENFTRKSLKEKLRFYWMKSKFFDITFWNFNDCG